MAYDVAIKCFIANGILSGDREDAGDKSGAASYEAKARQSFDVAGKLGAALNYSGSRINQDFGLAQAHELPRLVRDAGYLRRVSAMCRSAGLM